MKKIMLITIMCFILVPVFSNAARVRYEVVDVPNGGSIKGKVTTTIDKKDPVIPITIKPKESPEETELEKKTCIVHGQGQQAEMYIISPAKEVKNVLVIFEDIKKGRAAPKKDLKLDNIMCRFEPLVGISYLKSNYVIKNSDPLLHNTNLGKVLGGGKRRTVYNLALPHKDQVITKKNRVSGLIQVKCDAHPWMRANIYSSRHPYVTITDAEGNFEIKDIPPGTYKVRFWHEGFEEVVKEIEVKSGAVSDPEVVFTKTVVPAFMGGS